MRMPGFLIIGAPRAGTTTLYEGLRQHPEVYMSLYKEPWFFALEGKDEPFRGPEDSQGVRDLPTYSSLFDGVRNEKAVGEASTIYLHSAEAPVRIRQHLPNVKLVAVLRNPMDRAYSNYLQHVQEGREPLTDFASALEAEEERKRLGWSPFWLYREMGYYGEQLSRYFSLFDPGHIKIFLYEEFELDTMLVFGSICEFLGVDSAFEPEFALRHNLSGLPRSRALHDFLTKPNLVKKALKPFLPAKVRQDINANLLTSLKNRNLAGAPELVPKVREQLMVSYRKDVLKLQDLLRRDLSGWLE